MHVVATYGFRLFLPVPLTVSRRLSSSDTTIITRNRAASRLWGLTEVHYTDVIMTKMASQITSLTVVYSTVYSDADQRKHQSSASLAFVWGIHRDRWIPRTKGQLRGKCFHLMTSSWETAVSYPWWRHDLETFPHYWPFVRVTCHDGSTTKEQFALTR